jgi:hypothetical protein
MLVAVNVSVSKSISHQYSTNPLKGPEQSSVHVLIILGKESMYRV